MHATGIKPKGRAIGILRNAKTLEIEGGFDQSNIILDNIFIDLISFGNTDIPYADGNGNNSGLITLPNTVAVTTRVMSPSRINNTIPGSVSGVTDTTAIGNAIPNVVNPTFFPTSGSTEQYVEFTTRIPVPPVNMLINTVMLTDCASITQNQLNDISGYLNYAHVYAYASLATPCPQSTTQILDVYYRVQFPQAANYSTVQNREIAKRISGIYGNNSKSPLYGSANSNVFKLPVIKAADIPNITLNPMFDHTSLGSGIANFSTNGVFFKNKFNRNFSLTDVVGVMLGGVSYNDSASDLHMADVPFAPAGIQNVFGHTQSSTLQFLDVDGLPTGTGYFSPTGNWANKNAAANAGQYYSGEFPQMYNVNIVVSGNVGVAEYTYSKRPCFGYSPSVLANYGNSNTQDFTPVPALCTSFPTNNTQYNNFNAGVNEAQVTLGQDIYSGLLGDLTQIGTRQISSTVAYDAVSVVIPSMNRIMLYNLANSDYWYYTAAFTNIQQAAVVNGLIYVSCKATGLWVINPVTGSVTSLAAPAVGIDLSATNGVAAGYNNSVWVVGNNCIANYDGISTWTAYNQTTTPAFNSPGISDGNWSNVEYLVADASSVSGDLMLVRRLDATVDATSFGVWWSPVLGSAVNFTSALDNGAGYGMPRLNRSHLKCSATHGTWVIAWSSANYALTFGTNNTTLLQGPTKNVYTQGDDVFGTSNNFTSALNSVNFVPAATGDDRILQIGVANSLSNSTGGRAQLYLVKPDGSGIDTSLTESNANAASMCIPVNISPSFKVANSVEFASYGGSDMAVCVNLGNGVLFVMSAMLLYNGLGVSGWGNGIYSSLFIYPFDNSVAGAGSLAYLGKTSYGWNGSSWVAGSTTSKLTHTAVESLDSGLSINFVDGASGTSFVVTEFYNFAVCEGLLKDNATTNTIEDNIYFKKAYINVNDVNLAVIPVPTAGQTGLVGIDLNRSNAASRTTLDANNNTVFLDQNGSQFSVGDKTVIGDFVITYGWDNTNVNMKDIEFGIGYVGVAGSLDQNGRSGIVWGFSIDSTVSPGIGHAHAIYPPNGLTPPINGGADLGPASNVTSLGISRVGGVIQLIVNGVPITNSFFQPNPAQSRFNLICTPTNVWNPAAAVANRTCPAATIVSNGSDNAIVAGNGTTTGYFNPLFLAIDTDAQGAVSANINGVSAINIHVDGTAPLPGEVSVDPYMGTFIFNVADQGKAFSANYTYLTHE